LSSSEQQVFRHSAMTFRRAQEHNCNIAAGSQAKHKSRTYVL